MFIFNFTFLRDATAWKYDQSRTSSARRKERFKRSLSSHSVLQLFLDFDYWPLNRKPLNGGWTLLFTASVRKYTKELSLRYETFSSSFFLWHHFLWSNNHFYELPCYYQIYFLNVIWFICHSCLLLRIITIIGCLSIASYLKMLVKFSLFFPFLVNLRTCFRQLFTCCKDQLERLYLLNFGHCTHFAAFDIVIYCKSSSANGANNKKNSFKYIFRC